MNKQSGAATLLVTSMLLVAALVVTLGSYKSLFYQIKQANNQIVSRQEHWQAEGGLECGFTHIVDNNLSGVPANLAQQCTSYSIDILQGSLHEPDILISEVGYARVAKKLAFVGGGGFGAIRSTADIIAHGSAVLAPPDPGRYNNAGYYECVGAIVKRRFIASGIINKGLGGAIPPPSAGFDQSKNCGSSYQTETSVHTGIWQDADGNYQREYAELDIQQDPKLDPFLDYFGVEKDKWQSVRDDPAQNFLTVSMGGGKDIDCVSKFINELKDNKPYKIWIDGSCQITDTQLTSLKQLQSKNDKLNLFILVHNGVLGINGSGTIRGMLFHFNSGYAPTQEQWDNLKDIKPYLNANFNTYIDTLYGTSSGISPLLATYFQRGSFSLTGGQIFDADGQMALFDNSLRLAFNSDVINSFSTPINVKWVKGSWNDF
ncbi:hypothetical protein F0262_10795 [Vibrio rotiferianus]|uniref:Type 4 fimbrial biogenesis protein PilX N-terminal domain-containing protein n=1 Tax=Vibrio rotiferianus TaxID=190895 RepID=A0A7Y3Z8M7_9VIBR|nr:hypothetical protein [Vibrio rotiferianus]NOH48544.1 hypothetical protein [Vibrio rotiferianus]